MSRLNIPRWVAMTLITLVSIAALLVVFRLGNQASAGVTLNDPVVWIEDGSNGRLLQINGSTREITAQVDVGSDGDSIIALPQGRDAVFLNRTTGEFGVVGAISLAVDNLTELESQVGPLIGEQLDFKANLGADWENAFILDTERTLVFEPGGGRARLDIPNGELGDSVVDATGQLVVVTGDAGLVGVTTNRGLETLLTLPPLISPEAAHPGLVRAGDAVYLVDAARRVVNEIVGEEKLGPTVSICGSLEGVQIGGNVLTSSDGDHRILVHDGEAGILSVSEPSESDCVQIALGVTGDNWGDPIAVDSTAYLPNFATGEIVVVDLEDRVVIDTFRFSARRGVPFELEVFDGAVWANEPQGFRAAIVTSDELQNISKLGSFIVQSGEEGGEDGLGSLVTEGNDDGPRVFGEDGDLFGIDDDEGGQNGGGEDVRVDGEGEGNSVDESSDEAGDVDPQAGVEEGVLPLDLPDTPLIQVEDEIEVLDELIANFVFSAGTVNVGEEVRLSDESTGNPTSWNWAFGDGTSESGPDVSKIWPNEGIFTVTLFVANAAGDEAQQTHEFTVIAVDVLRVPTADFTFRSEIIEVGEEIVFSDVSTGEPDSLAWTFGDGSTDVGSQVAHTYAEPGVYEVSLTASNEAGPNTTSALITVVEGVQAPTAIIGSFPGVVEVGQVITLSSESTNSPTAVSWGFDDGDTALGTEVRHSWDRPGTYRVRLSVSNSAGADETFDQIVVEPRVNPPVARFGESTLEIVQGELINFSDLSLNVPTTLTWEFGDGSTARGPNVSHSWNEPGTFTVTLTAANEAGSDDVAKTVTVIPLPPDPPTAAFNVASATVPVNAVVSFTDASTGDPTEWAWDFGDGTRSTAQNPPHAFAAPGTFTVTLTASNAGGATSVSKTIVVVNPPVASFTRVADEFDVEFTDTSTNGPETWSWDFGDGSTSTVQNPLKTYDAAGTYTVTLVASNGAGSSTPFSEEIDVVRRPTASFTTTIGGLTAQFADTSIDGPTLWAWDFGDGNTSSSADPTHNYEASGTFTVALTVSNGAGSDSATDTISVELAPPEAILTCNVVGGGVACDGGASTSAVFYSWSAPGSIAQSGTTTDAASFTYSSTGDYDITLTVENSEGITDSATETVSVEVPEPPTITNVSVVSNNDGVVELSATASNGPTSWTWGSGGAVSSSGATTSNPTFTYDSEGSVTVTATATNAVGDSDPVQESFVVDLVTPPVVNSVTAVNAGGGVITLSASVANGGTYAWSSPAGGSFNSTTSTAPTLTVTANGTYPINLTVTNADGFDTGTTSVTIIDIVAPITLGSVSQAESPGGTVDLSATSTGGPTSWLWTVAGSNEGTSTSVSPTFTFNANNNYAGSVIASKSGTASVTLNFTVSVTGIVVVVPPPTATFSVTPNSPPSLVVSFAHTGTAAPGAIFAWVFGDGTTGAGASVTHTYAAPGPVTVTLTVTNPDTQMATTSQGVTVN